MMAKTNGIGAGPQGKMVLPRDIKMNSQEETVISRGIGIKP
jgi:hypothetical protein